VHLYGKIFDSIIALDNRKKGDRVGAGRVQKQAVLFNDPPGGHRGVCEGVRARVRVSHGMVHVKLLF